MICEAGRAVAVAAAAAAAVGLLDERCVGGAAQALLDQLLLHVMSSGAEELSMAHELGVEHASPAAVPASRRARAHLPIFLHAGGAGSAGDADSNPKDHSQRAKDAVAQHLWHGHAVSEEERATVFCATSSTPRRATARQRQVDRHNTSESERTAFVATCPL